MSEWQPIETAPKDVRILCYARWASAAPEIATMVLLSGDLAVCDPNEATEYDREVYRVTHWMPLPAPPEAQEANR